MSAPTYGIDRRRNPGFYALSRIVVAVTLVGILGPILYIFSLSIRTERTVYQDTLLLIPKEVTHENYLKAWNLSKSKLDVDFLEMFRNSVICTIGSIALAIAVAVLSAFSFSHFRFKGKEVLFTTIIASYVVPAQVLLIPLFFIMVRLLVINTYLAVVLPYVGFCVPIATLILRSFFEQIPYEITEAAIIDGARSSQILAGVVLPMSSSALATCIILLFLETWNEFLYAMVFLQKPWIQTIPVAIAKIAGGRFHLPLGTYGAAIMITIFPVLVIFVVFQKWFVAGVTMGSVKG